MSSGQDDLSQFRETWLREVHDRHNKPAQKPPKEEPEYTAVQWFAEAVEREQAGQLNEALLAYRQAYRMDAEVHRAYAHITKMGVDVKIVPQAGHLPRRAPNIESLTASLQRFSLEPDYEAGKTGESSAGLRNSVVNAQANNPLVPCAGLDTPAEHIVAGEWTHAEHAIESGYTLAPEEKVMKMVHCSSKKEYPVLEKLPDDVILLILKMLVLSAPMVKNIDDSDDKKYRSKPWRRDFPSRDIPWVTDIEALERFARVSRRARFISLESTLWKQITPRAYPMHNDPIWEMYNGDARTAFIEHDRVRFDGCFISTVTYVRQGDAAAAAAATLNMAIQAPPSHDTSKPKHRSTLALQTAPSHVVIYYRYLRFFPDGHVMSVQSTDPPAAIVRRLRPGVYIDGLRWGRWRLDDKTHVVDCFDLVDAYQKPSEIKYEFHYALRLKSTHRGRMNKLEFIAMDFARRDLNPWHDLARADLPVDGIRPFIFSRVASYAAE